MKKVLYVLNYMNIGGTEKAFLNLVDTLPPEEYDITLLLLEKKGGFLDQVPERVHIVKLDNYLPDIKKEIMEPPVAVCRSYLKRGKLLSAAGLLITHLIYKVTGNRTLYFRFTLRGVQMVDGFDEYHAYAGPFGFISALVAYKCKGGKKVQWIHFDVSKIWFDVRTNQLLYRKMNEIRVVSCDALESVLTLIPEIEDKTVVSRNLVSRESCRKMAADGTGFLDGFNGIRIVTLGRLSKEKGQDIIPVVASELKKKGYCFRWYLIGDGDLRCKIEEIIKELGLGEEVCLLGTKINPYPFLKEADIYVQTSVHEGFCLTLSEARAFDLPVVSTECAGAHEQLNEFHDCYVVNRNTNAMVSAIEKVIEMKKRLLEGKVQRMS